MTSSSSSWLVSNDPTSDQDKSPSATEPRPKLPVSSSTRTLTDKRDSARSETRDDDELIGFPRLSSEVHRSRMDEPRLSRESLPPPYDLALQSEIASLARARQESTDRLSQLGSSSRRVRDGPSSVRSRQTTASTNRHRVGSEAGFELDDGPPRSSRQETDGMRRLSVSSAYRSTSSRQRPDTSLPRSLTATQLARLPDLSTQQRNQYRGEHARKAHVPRSPSSVVSVSSSVFSHQPTPSKGRLQYQADHDPSRHTSIASVLAGIDAQDATARGIAYAHDSLAKRFARWMSKSGKKQLLVPSVLLASFIIRATVSLGPYSGYVVAPMYGDLEAQRHWMAVTYHLPPSEWYFHRLEYWGLDYPPLTAYLSWLFGAFAHHLGNPAWVALRTLPDAQVASEDDTKLFLRLSVIFMDFLIYVPAVLLYLAVTLGGKRGGSSRSRRSGRTQAVALMTILFQPALILIDNGHFQYNSVMLGLAVAAFALLHRGNDLLAAILFVGALGFKQMALYFAPAMFFFLLGKCVWLQGHHGVNLFLNLAIVGVGSLALVFAPFLSSTAQLLQTLHRIFPFQRGLFEDKVANFWCGLNVVIKLRQLASIPVLARLALVATLLALLPSAFIVLYTSYSHKRQMQVEAPVTKIQKSLPPTLKLLTHSLFVSSMSFFLFSFQVHEKSILLPLLPITLLMAGSEPGQSGNDWDWAALLNNVGVFSMWPLLKRDGLGVQYVALTLLWNRVIGHDPLRMPSSFLKALTLVTYSCILAMHVLELIAPAPAHLPDLYPVLNLTLSAAIFGLSWLWGIKRQVEESWAIIGMSNVSASVPPSRVASPSGNHVSLPRITGLRSSASISSRLSKSQTYGPLRADHDYSQSGVLPRLKQRTSFTSSAGFVSDSQQPTNGSRRRRKDSNMSAVTSVSQVLRPSRRARDSNGGAQTDWEGAHRAHRRQTAPVLQTDDEARHRSARHDLLG
ncbi:glycosyltransferase family 57 protein [Mixia osmundae IAM 14324]|uniref:glycosyltransferase family 57 protein n=1 Tax=Mixia osmundae (strain CBS 9802 / IAM 14324 / JCM 22182 / KY 12970) TaxID=764103 RepID=UPI0004A553CD|nr:glycosyltransferase family 57 protein [Mixia osmundae IAM 14324]KEI42721.1 glycosyltransferase family 57 protein [Mixia osmundae IAM 14324]